MAVDNLDKFKKDRTFISVRFQTVDKPAIIFENGVAGGVALTGSRAAAPHSAPGTGCRAEYGLCACKANQDTQPFTEGKGFGDRDREFALFL